MTGPYSNYTTPSMFGPFPLIKIDTSPPIPPPM
jgi:hypothetical protein